ncbi:MAG TPA: Kdo hydroxylase family protein, partial [Chthonomonadales bacterium]|nr:Kdo hydroxylase family protein [Chthonomonadales bacterium]
GRPLPMSRRNDLLHLDAFPTRPTHGGRILRAFTNIHPSDDRIWATSEPFETLAEQFALPAGLSGVTSPIASARRSAAEVARKVGVKVPARSAYDEFMLHFHNYLKSNATFQQTGKKQSWAFAPGVTWISFTDQIAHAVLSGRYALEQTCIVPFSAMVQPDRAPLRVLERLAGRRLARTDGSRSA